MSCILGLWDSVSGGGRCPSCGHLAADQAALGEGPDHGKFNNIFVSAGHATTLPRQRDHLFRPQSCWLWHSCYTVLVVATPFRHRDIDIFWILCCLWSSITLSRCRFHEAQKLSRAQFCIFKTKMLQNERFFAIERADRLMEYDRFYSEDFYFEEIIWFLDRISQNERFFAVERAS